MAKEAGKPLRDWTVGSYTQEGRPVSSLENKQSDKQMPTASTGMSGENQSSSADKSRRNR